MRLRFVALGLCLLALVSLAVVLRAQTPPLLRLNCTQANFPSCGWGAADPNPYWTSNLLPTSGPSGGPAVEIAQVPADHHAQYYLGWWSPSGLPGASQGASRFLRFRIKTIPPINLAGVADVWSDKFIIMGDGNNPLGRVICVLRDNGMTSDNLGLICMRNSDGLEHGTAIVPITPNVWNNFQMEFRSSTTTSSGDGRLKTWKNTNDVAVPTSQSPPFQLNTTNWQNINVGFYANATLRAGSRAVLHLADVEFDTRFDAAWHGGVSPPPDPDPDPPPPPPPPDPPPSDWTYCAMEGGFCSFSGTQEVRYGAGTSFVYRLLTNGTPCTNAVFGDPLRGTIKQCHRRAVTSPPPPPPVDPCVSDPLRVTRITWPSANTGRRTLTFDVGTKAWVRELLDWRADGHHVLTVTDSRGCVATVTR